MDIDCCLNVRVTGCSVNSPWDDGICLKASYALGALRPCSNITISDCYVSGNYDEGSLLDGTFRRSDPAYHSYRTGRIKLGTESNGDFKNIAITNCVFDDCQGLAIESVDGSHIEDVAISNITMRHVASAPIFIRLGSRRRGPGSPPVGSIRRVTISNLVASDADWRLGSVISGIPGHDVEDVHLSNLRVAQQGGGDAARRVFTPPEEEARYPEPGMFGPMPSYGFFFRHAAGIEMSHVTVTFDRDEPRPAVVLDDVREATFDHLNLQAPVGGAPRIRLRQVSDFSVTESRDLPDAKRPGLTATGSL
jgi:polygalacturonase